VAGRIEGDQTLDQVDGREAGRGHD
jgi:hypothetical protein